MAFEKVLLSELIYNDVFTRKVIPFINEDYFSNSSEKQVFKYIKSFVGKYNTTPTKEALAIIATEDNMNEVMFNDVINIISEMEESNNNIDWLISSTEKFCQDKALYNSMVTALQVMDRKIKRMGQECHSHFNQSSFICFIRFSRWAQLL